MRGGGLSRGDNQHRRPGEALGNSEEHQRGQGGWGGMSEGTVVGD